MFLLGIIRPMASSMKPHKFVVHSAIDDIQSEQWNRLVEKNYPFLKHEFLSALEKNRCVGEHVGWIPKHITHSKKNKLIGALPLYEKHNSWGEFVFDHAWADAFQRYDMEYYPKLLNAIPFTPASGQRILMEHKNNGNIAALLIAAANKLVEQDGYSGLHCLFPQPGNFKILNQQNAMTRNDCQFHWHNNGYSSFNEFLDTLKFKKRKNIKQERRKVVEAGVVVSRLNGNSATEQDWEDFADMYEKIYDRKYGMPGFNLAFFKDVADSIPHQILLVLAKKDGTSIAAALMYFDDDTLYGRHWGCEQYVDSLHFEVCYYQGIEFCIEHGLNRFDPGAQGEHKIARGFVPTRTRSLHWMAKNPFKEAIEQFVNREQLGVQHYIDAVSSHSPYNSKISTC